MAKTSTANKTNDAQDPFHDIELPSDGKEVVGDVDGYWDPDKSAIRFKPLSAKMFDNSNDPLRASILILGKLTAPCPLYTTDDNKERHTAMAQVGASVGVWYKPGMRNIIKRCGVDCYLKKSGEKDTGKPNPMTTFQLVAGDETHKIPVTEDFRDKSKNFNTPFDNGPIQQKTPDQLATDEDPGF